MTTGINTNGWNSVYPQYGFNTNLLQQASAQQQTAPVSFAGRQQQFTIPEENKGIGVGGWATIGAIGLTAADLIFCKGKHLKGIWNWGKGLFGKGGNKALENGLTRTTREIKGGTLVEISKDGKIIQEHLLKDGKAVGRYTIDLKTGNPLTVQRTAQQTKEVAKAIKEYKKAQKALLEYTANHGKFINSNPAELAKLEQAVADAKAAVLKADGNKVLAKSQWFKAQNAEAVAPKPAATPAPAPTPTVQPTAATPKLVKESENSWRLVYEQTPAAKANTYLSDNWGDVIIY